MGNRLTLPLLLLAALLAGGAFFWLADSRRSTGSGEGAALPVASAPGAATAPELRDPGAPDAAPAAHPAPARIELDELPAPKEAARAGAASEKVKVSGTVVDRFGAPIPGARVVVARSSGFPMDLELERDFPWLERQRAECDGQGRFELEGVEPGTLQVSLRARGFAPHQQQGIRVPPGGCVLAPFVLARGAILSGVVVEENGRGVGGARIVPVDVGDGPGMFMIGSREPVAVTSSDGTFRIDELACGAWRFRVRSEDHPDFTAEGLSEEPGVEQGGLRWQLAPGATIAGTVTGVPGGEAGKLEVRAARGQSGGADFFAFAPARSAKVDANGVFQVRGLEVGEPYVLQARRAGEAGDFDTWGRSRSGDVKARAGDSGVVLAYQPEAALVFTVFDAATRAPIEKLEVESGVDWTQPLRDDEGRPRTVFPGGMVRVGELRPGSADERVQLVVRATGYREYSRSDIAVRAGQELDLGALYLDPVPVVRVHVTDQKGGAPVVGARVRMQKDQGDLREVRRTISIGDEDGHEAIEFGDGRSALTDEQGWAEISSFEGDTVQLLVRADGFAPAQVSGLFLPKGQRLEQEVRLTPGGEVLVHVVDAQGLPKAGARVQHRSDAVSPMGGVFALGGLAGHGGQGGHGDEVTDAQGTLLFQNLEAGAHSFRLNEDGGGGAMFATMETVIVGGPQGGSDDWSEIQVAEGERGELTLQAAPRGALAGRVREAGKVLAGATVRLTKADEAGEGPGMPMRLPGMGGGPEARTDGEGRYRVEDVKEGRYKLAVEHPTRRMPQELTLDLRSGENSFDVDLSLAIIEGRVVDEQGKGVAGVRVWPERKAGDEGGRAMRFRMVMIDDSGGGGVVDSGQFGQKALTDADGRYTLRGVASDVDLVVKAEGDAVQPGQSETVRVGPDEVKRAQDLCVEAAGSINVEASLADGAPARFQLVQAEFLDDTPTPVEPKFTFLQSGSTSLKGLKPGRWKVNVKSAQGGPGNENPGQDQEILVKAGETTAATFEVE